MPPLRFRPRAPSIRTLHTFSTPAPRLRAKFPLRQPPTPHPRHLSSLPYISTCPPSTCTCLPSPPELDIDRKTPLLNTMAHYASHVVVCSGKPDWSSRIEDEATPAGDFVRGMKGVVGRGGERFDPFNNIVTTLSSFPASTTTAPATTTILLFPSFHKIEAVPHDAKTLSTLATAYLSAHTLHPMHTASLTPAQKPPTHLLRDPALASILPAPSPITHPVILICGHGGRDERCGILGPMLETEFKKVLVEKKVEADVATISHIGGHKFAGNVIVYIPPNWGGGGAERDGDGSALAGTGLWYGRVGPENVEGIVVETVVKGRVIADLFRGGITQGGGNLGRVLEAQLQRDRGESGEEGLKLKPKARG